MLGHPCHRSLGLFQDVYFIDEAALTMANQLVSWRLREEHVTLWGLRDGRGWEAVE